MTPTEKNEGYRAADEMADRQREISVSEFFLKNRHLLGFDSGAKALVMTVKEAVDNAEMWSESNSRLHGKIVI